MFTKKIHIVLLSMLVTFLVMNAITHNYTIFLIGKYGKLATAMVGIIIFQKSYAQFVYFIKRHRFIVLFWVLCMLFTFYRILDKGVNVQLIQNNVLFIIFIYFFYLLSLQFKRKHFKNHAVFLRSMSSIINLNLIFWTFVAVVFPFKMWHTLENRTGLGLFYENYLQLGIFACVGGIVNLAMVKLSKSTKRKKIFFIYFLLYGLLVILSNSRNSQFVLVAFIVMNLVPFLNTVIIKYFYVFLSIIIILSAMYFSSDLLVNESVASFTTGRSVIWYFIYEHYLQNSIFSGEGIFGLNNTILENNLSANYYFQRLEFLYFHSSYVEMFCAAGLIGMIFFILYIIKSLKNKMKSYIVKIIICILLGGLFESYLVQPTILISFLFWYFMVSRDNSKFKMILKTPEELKTT